MVQMGSNAQAMVVSIGALSSPWEIRTNLKAEDFTSISKVSRISWSRAAVMHPALMTSLVPAVSVKKCSKLSLKLADAQTLSKGWSVSEIQLSYSKIRLLQLKKSQQLPMKNQQLPMKRVPIPHFSLQEVSAP